MRIKPGPTSPATTAAAESAARTLAVFPTEHSVSFDCEPGTPERGVIEVALAADGVVLKTVRSPAPEAAFHGVITGLEPDTEYALTIRLESGPVLVHAYRFRTYSLEHRAELIRSTSMLGAGHLEQEGALDVMLSRPDVRWHPLIIAELARHQPDESPIFPAAARLAREVRDGALADALVAQLSGATSPARRGEALLAAVAARRPAGIQQAFDALPQATAPTLVEAGCRACVRIGGARAHEKLRRMLTTGRIPFTWGRALARTDPAAVLREAASAPATAPGMIAAEVMALLEVGSDEAVRVLASRLADGRWPADYVVEALAIIGTPAARTALGDALAGGRPAAAMAILKGLQRVGPGERVLLVRARIAEGPPALRREAVVALAGTDGPEAVAELRAALERDEPETAGLAAWGLALSAERLGASERESLVDPVRRLASSDRDESGLACWALARLQGPSAAGTLRSALAARPAEARLIGVAWALAECGDRDSATTLRAIASGAGVAAREALRRAAARLEGAAPSGTRTYLLPAGVRVMRSGIRLVAGQSLEVNASGWWGTRGQPLQRVYESVQTQWRTGVPLAVAASVATETWAVTGAPRRHMVTRAGELCLSSFEGLPGSADVAARQPVHGFALVTVAP